VRVELRFSRVESDHSAGASGKRLQHRGDCGAGRRSRAAALVALGQTRAQLAGRKRPCAAAQPLQHQRIDNPARTPAFFHRVGGVMRNPERRTTSLTQPFVHAPGHRRGLHQLDRQERPHAAVGGVFAKGH